MIKELYSQFSYDEYLDFFKYTLGAFILIGAFILRIAESKSEAKFKSNDKNLLVVFIVFLILFAGQRGLNIGTDTINYYKNYYLPGIQIRDLKTFFNHFESDFLFELIMFLSFKFKSFNFFLTVIAIIYNLGLFFFVRKFTKKSQDGSSLLLFLMICCCFTFLTLEVNVIRNSVAFVFVLLGFNYIISNEIKYALIFFTLAFLSHNSALIPIAAILTIHFTRNVALKYFFIAYIFFIAVALVGFGFHNLPFISLISGDNFSLTDNFNYNVGFRIDFVLYNSFFLFLGFKFGDINNKKHIILLKYFILTSIIFYLYFHIPFSDRVGAYSWIAIPLILFTTIKNSYPNNHLYYSSIVSFLFFLLNYYVLF